MSRQYVIVDINDTMRGHDWREQTGYSLFAKEIGGDDDFFGSTGEAWRSLPLEEKRRWNKIAMVGFPRISSISEQRVPSLKAYLGSRLFELD